MLKSVMLLTDPTSLTKNHSELAIANFGAISQSIILLKIFDTYFPYLLSFNMTVINFYPIIFKYFAARSFFFLLLKGIKRPQSEACETYYISETDNQ